MELWGRRREGKKERKTEVSPSRQKIEGLGGARRHNSSAPSPHGFIRQSELMRLTSSLFVHMSVRGTPSLQYLSLLEDTSHCTARLGPPSCPRAYLPWLSSLCCGP